MASISAPPTGLNSYREGSPVYSNTRYAREGYGGVYSNTMRARRVLGNKSSTPAGPDYLGVAGALNPPPQVSAYYNALLGQAGRGIAAQADSARTAAGEGLEARGFGQSGLYGRTMAEIGRGQAVAGQQASAGIQGLQFQQLMSALDFERQKQLMALQAKYSKQLQGNPWLNALGNLGSAAAYLFPPKGAAPSYTEQSWQPSTA